MLRSREGGKVCNCQDDGRPRHAAEMSATKRLADVISVTIAWQAISLKVYWARHRRRGPKCRTRFHQFHRPGGKVPIAAEASQFQAYVRPVGARCHVCHESKSGGTRPLRKRLLLTWKLQRTYYGYQPTKMSPIRRGSSDIMDETSKHGECRTFPGHAGVGRAEKPRRRWKVLGAWCRTDPRAIGLLFYDMVTAYRFRGPNYIHGPQVVAAQGRCGTV
ncbi:hypothetical protein EDB92DRAFT_1818296 [Lactarius akahatsu]|uniref:Uncharacterized protein n=1 Tax=Lactarius akahatsu TaxID=416441 RepID=A0AAD4QB93_9AGAM|nr:hypothetical protein EDB92DRAFT_1818296 [Lactarius akahatsu]